MKGWVNKLQIWEDASADISIYLSKAKSKTNWMAHTCFFCIHLDQRVKMLATQGFKIDVHFFHLMFQMDAEKMGIK